MRNVVQRVSSSSVTVDGDVVGSIGSGFVVLVGIAEGDGPADVEAFVDKLLGLRVFADETGKMNRSIVDTGGAVLVVSQFTLLGSVRKGRRPSFTDAAAPEAAEMLVQAVADAIAARSVEVATGRFGAKMDVSLVNDGPVTFVLDVAGGRVT